MTTPFGLLPSGPIADPGLERATDHKERAIGVLLSQLRDKPRFTKLIEILIRPFQEIEDAIFDLYILRRLENAFGDLLDSYFGHILVEPRGGLGDEDYRAVLRIKARVIFSRGTGPDLIKIAKLFLQSDEFTYDEHYPASIEMAITAAITDGRLGLLKRFLRKAKSAGVRMDVVDARGPGTRFHYGAEGTGVGYGVGTYGGVI